MRAEYEAARQARAAYRLLGDEAGGVADPLAELLKLGREVLTWKQVCREMLAEVTDLRYRSAGSGEQLDARVALYERSLERAGKLLADIARLRIEDRLAAVSEQQGAAIAGVIQAVLTDPIVALTADQLRAARGSAAHHLRALRTASAGAGKVGAS